MDKIVSILKSIGLNKNEVKIFLDLTKKDISSVSEISKRTEIHRSNVYDSLRVLMEKGFVSERAEGKKKLFRALNPMKIKEYVLQKGREVDSIMSELQKISAKKPDKSNVSVSYGIFALRSVFMGFLDTETEIRIYGVPKGLMEKIGEGFLNEFHDKRIEKGIAARSIYMRDAFTEKIIKMRERDYTEVKCGQRKDNFEVTTIACKDRIFIIVLSDVVSIIEITSKEVAESYEGYFEILWHNATLY